MDIGTEIKRENEGLLQDSGAVGGGELTEAGDLV